MCLQIMSSDFAGLAGLSISTIGTVALASEVAKSMRTLSSPPRRRMPKRKMKGKKKK